MFYFLLVILLCYVGHIGAMSNQPFTLVPGGSNKKGVQFIQSLSQSLTETKKEETTNSNNMDVEPDHNHMEIEEQKVDRIMEIEEQKDRISELLTLLSIPESENPNPTQETLNVVRKKLKRRRNQDKNEQINNNNDEKIFKKQLPNNPF